MRKTRLRRRRRRGTRKGGAPGMISLPNIKSEISRLEREKKSKPTNQSILQKIEKLKRQHNTALADITLLEQRRDLYAEAVMNGIVNEEDTLLEIIEQLSQLHGK